MRAYKIFGLERCVCQHGEYLDFCDRVIPEAELVHEVEDDLRVFVGVGPRQG